MWKMILPIAALVFLGCLAVCALASWWTTGWIDWPPAIAISAGITVFMTVRFYLMLRKLRMQKLQRLQVEQQAVQELVDDMARLSPADLSVYVAAQQQLVKQEDEISFCTAGGSPNHHVLVQMTDLGLAAPARMEGIGEGEKRFVVARYSLTARGRASLGNLLQIVGQRRRFFASQQA
jgi:membrane protein implicated in regulation of membrane protease activity